jgi:hypothetical protein
MNRSLFKPRYIFPALFLIALLAVAFVLAPKCPDGAIWKSEEIFREKAPDGFQAIVGWVQAVSEVEEIPGIVEVEYIKLIRAGQESEEQVFSEEFNSQELRMEGGLFIRYPKWFATNENEPMDLLVEGGNLKLDFSRGRDKIYHWWTERIPYEAGYDYYLEAKLRVAGNAAVQFGSDFWIDMNSDYSGYSKDCESVNNCEYWVSDWISDTNGEFVTIRAPKKIK